MSSSESDSENGSVGAGLVSVGMGVGASLARAAVVGVGAGGGVGRPSMGTSSASSLSESGKPTCMVVGTILGNWNRMPVGTQRGSMDLIVASGRWVMIIRGGEAVSGLHDGELGSRLWLVLGSGLSSAVLASTGIPWVGRVKPGGGGNVLVCGVSRWTG